MCSDQGVEEKKNERNTIFICTQKQNGFPRIIKKQTYG